MHFFPYPDRTRSWIGVYIKNIFKWKKYSFRVIIHFNPLHPSPSLYLSGLYVSILQSKPFVVFFNLKVVTHGLKITSVNSSCYDAVYAKRTTHKPTQTSIPLALLNLQYTSVSVIMPPSSFNDNNNKHFKWSAIYFWFHLPNQWQNLHLGQTHVETSCMHQVTKYVKSLIKLSLPRSQIPLSLFNLPQEQAWIVAIKSKAPGNERLRYTSYRNDFL